MIDHVFSEVYDVLHMLDYFLALYDVIKHRKTPSTTPEPHSDFGCQAVAMGLSPRTHGRFRSFLAGKLIWLGRRHIQKSNTLRPICEISEGFFITMATDLDLARPKYFSCHWGPKTYLHAKFHQDPCPNKKVICNIHSRNIIFNV